MELSEEEKYNRSKVLQLVATHPNTVEYNHHFEVTITLKNYEDITNSEYKGYDLFVTVALLVNPDLELSGATEVQANKDTVIFGNLKIRSLSNSTREQEFSLYFILKKKDNNEFMPVGGKNTTAYMTVVKGKGLDTVATVVKDKKGVVSIENKPISKPDASPKEETKENKHGTAEHLVDLFSPKDEMGKVEWEDILGVTDIVSRRKPEIRSEDNRYRISKANSDLEKLVEGPEIKPTDIKETGRFLGQGATGAVHEVVLKGKKCAMKQILGDMRGSPLAIKDFKQEMKTMSWISHHPNVVLYLGGFADEKSNTYFLITELCEKSLEDYLKDPYYQSTSVFNRLMIGYDILLGLSYLHGQGFAHCDLKPGNILRDSMGVWKVADFGFSRLFGNTNDHNFVTAADNPKGAPLYMGPERLQYITSRNYEAPFQKSSDVYSFAILLWQILTGSSPFKCKKVIELKDIVIIQKKRPARDRLLEACGEELVRSVWDLLTEMWQEDPEKSFEVIIKKYEDVLINNAIWDRKGRKFWKENFCTHTFEFSIPVSQFIKEACKGKEIDLKKDKSIARAVECIKRTLCKDHNEDPDPHVSIAKFGVVCDALGPWRITRSYGNTITFTGIIGRIERLCTKPWFMPQLTVSEAHKYLQHETDGIFLLRFSTRNHCLVLSMKNKGRGEEYYIKRKDDSFFINHGETYKSVEELISELTEKQMLKKACSLVTIIPSETKAEIEFEYQTYLLVPTPLGKDEKTKQLKERSAVLRAKKAEAQRKLTDKDENVRWEGVAEINRIVEEYEAIQKELEDREQTKKDCIVM